MRYAIVDNGAVTNIIALNDRNASDFPAAVKLGDRPVGIGDTYTGGKFYRDGKEVLTAQEEIEQYKTALQTLGVETEEAVSDES